MKNLKFILSIIIGLFFANTTFALTALDPFEWNDGTYFSWKTVKGKDLILLRYGLYDNGKEINSYTPTTNEIFIYGTYNDTDVLLQMNCLDGNVVYTAHLVGDKQNLLLINDVQNKKNPRVWIKIIMFRINDDSQTELYTVDNYNTYRVFKVRRN